MVRGFSIKSVFILTGYIIVLLQGCAFEPLYQHAQNWPCVKVNLITAAVFNDNSSVDMSMVKAEQKLKSHVEHTFRREEKLCYRLEVATKIDKENIDIQPDGVVTRQRLLLSVIFSLFDPENQYLFTSNSRTVSAYNLVPKEYSNFITEEKTKERLTETIAQDIVVQLASFFNAKHAVKKQVLKRENTYEN